MAVIILFVVMHENNPLVGGSRKSPVGFMICHWDSLGRVYGNEYETNQCWEDLNNMGNADETTERLIDEIFEKKKFVMMSD